MCDGSSRVCQFRRISARILDDRINTLRRDLNSKRLYDRYRSEHSRNGVVGWCNTGSNHLLRYSRKHDENEEQGRMVPMQSFQILETGLQPITAEVGTGVRIAERAGQSDVWERIGTAETPVAESTTIAVTQGMVMRRVVLKHVSVDRRREAVQ